MTNHNEGRTDFYTVKYTSFGSDVATELRREVFGEDIGQQGWRTAAEQVEIAEFLGIVKASRVLDVCCGSGGPSLALVQRTGCRLTGIDREEAGIVHARAQASVRGISDRSTFELADCCGRCRLRTVALMPCYASMQSRTSRIAPERCASGRACFATGGAWCLPMLPSSRARSAKSELDMRTASGFFLFVPPGLNEQAIKTAGLNLLRCEDRTAAMAEIGARMYSARLRHASALQQEEGADGFQKRQGLYAIATELAKSHRLSRFLYVAEKSARRDR